MDTKIVKNKPQELEFGDYGNRGTMIPIAIEKISEISRTLSVHILWSYDDKTERTIVLCEDDLEAVDYESFGTTYEAELAKLGITPEGVQSFGSGAYKRYYNITEKDGTIIPYQKFIVTYDVVHPKTGAIINHLSKEVTARGPERAIERVKSRNSYGTYSNYKATPIQ